MMMNTKTIKRVLVLRFGAHGAPKSNSVDGPHGAPTADRGITLRPEAALQQRPQTLNPKP